MFGLGVLTQVHYHNILTNPGPQGQIVISNVKQIIFDADHACLTVHQDNRSGNQITEFDLKPINQLNVSIGVNSCVFQLIAQ